MVNAIATNESSPITSNTANNLMNAVSPQILPTKDGSIWIATIKGLIKVGLKGDYQHYTEKDGLFTSQTRALHESSDGSIWIGYLRSSVISRFSEERIVHVINDRTITGGCRSIKTSTDGQKSIATAGNGLLSFDNEGVLSYKLEDNFPNGTVSRIKSTHQKNMGSLELRMACKRQNHSCYLFY